MDNESGFRVCSECFHDEGLRLDAREIGLENRTPCPNCGSTAGKMLDGEHLRYLSHRYFVWGTTARAKYGGAPRVQFNEHQKTSIRVPDWLEADLRLIEETLGVGFFHYGPRLWMIGEVEPLKALQNPAESKQVIEKITHRYPKFVLDSEDVFYRVRKDPASPDLPREYDSPPVAQAGTGRLDSEGLPVMYASPDLQVCIHESRVTAEDTVYVATLSPSHPLKLLNLSALLEEEGVTEFESLDMAVHMLFLAGAHAYPIARQIALAAKANGFDGLVFPSYFSLLRLGIMPFETAYGISLRRYPTLQKGEEMKAVPNLAIFGRPIEESKVAVRCINKLILRKVEYSVHFGPVGIK